MRADPGGLTVEVWVFGLSLAGITGSIHDGGTNVSVGVSEVCETGRSLVQVSPYECRVSECDLGASWTRLKPTRAVEPRKKHPLVHINR